MKRESYTELYFLPQDAAEICECSTATVKRIADELALNAPRTRRGVRIFTADHISAIKAERERRARI